jgi:hypothetical protein
MSLNISFNADFPRQMSLVQTESRQLAPDVEEMKKFAGRPMIVQPSSITQQAGLLLTGSPMV